MSKLEKLKKLDNFNYLILNITIILAIISIFYLDNRVTTAKIIISVLSIVYIFLSTYIYRKKRELYTPKTKPLIRRILLQSTILISVIPIGVLFIFSADKIEEIKRVILSPKKSETVYIMMKVRENNITEIEKKINKNIANNILKDQSKELLNGDLVTLRKKEEDRYKMQRLSKHFYLKKYQRYDRRDINEQKGFMLVIDKTKIKKIMLIDKKTGKEEEIINNKEEKLLNGDKLLNNEIYIKDLKKEQRKKIYIYNREENKITLKGVI